jgi:o-succinylbenzoate synthase
VKLSVRIIEAPLRAEFVSSSGSLATRELLLIELEDSEGHRGFGEAAPLPSYDGVSLDDARMALGDCVPVLAALGEADRPTALAACREAAVLPQAIAAVDLALWDLEGRRTARPVWSLLGLSEPAPVVANATIAAVDRATAAAEAADAVAAGFTCVKVKVGLADDAGRLAAIRAAAGPEMDIRIDANGAWTVDQALATLRVLEPCRIELCEEPCAELEANREVAAASEIPVALDESTVHPGALDARLCRAVCLKISRCGGITGVLETAARARQAGYQVYLASTLDGPLGVAAALHAAAVVDPDRPCGLATLGQFVREDPLPGGRGLMQAPRGPGLGITADWYRPS